MKFLSLFLHLHVNSAPTRLLVSYWITPTTRLFRTHVYSALNSIWHRIAQKNERKISIEVIFSVKHILWQIKLHIFFNQKLVRRLRSESLLWTFCRTATSDSVLCTWVLARCWFLISKAALLGVKIPTEGSILGTPPTIKVNKLKAVHNKVYLIT